MLDDPASRRIAIAILGVMILWLAWLLSALVLGVISPATEAPRTHAERAISVYRAEIEAGSTSPVLWGEYIGVLISTGQYAQAQQVIDAALPVMTAGRSYLLIERARLAQARGEHRVAISFAEETVAAATIEMNAEDERLDLSGRAMNAGLPPTYGRALIVKAESLAVLGHPEAAIEAYNRYLDKHPTAANVLVARGDLHAETGDVARARADYREALRYVPDSEPAREGLERTGDRADD